MIQLLGPRDASWAGSKSAIVAALALIAVAPTLASAYVTFGQGFGSKWGDPNFGTPAVVTWGYILDSTTADPDFRMDPFGFPDSTGVVGTSRITDLRARVDGQYGGGSFDGAIQRAFDTWSSVADITFVGPIADSGLPFASAGATSPDIRIGAFVPAPGHSFDFVGGVGFGPPGPFGDDPLAGDIIFNFNAIFRVESGVEDVTPVPSFGNDLEGLMLHELGHAAIGLGHPPWQGDVPDHRAMYVGDYANNQAPFCCETVNRFPHTDDIAGAQYVYGPPSTPGPRAGDIDLDGDVDRHDAALFALHMGRQSDSAWTTGDFDFDAATTLADLAILQAKLGTAASNASKATNSPAGSPVPEPSAFALLAFGGTACSICRLRRTRCAQRRAD